MPWPSPGDDTKMSSTTSASSAASGSPIMPTTSTPTTPDDVPDDPFNEINNRPSQDGQDDSLQAAHRNSSQSTLRKTSSVHSDQESLYSRLSKGSRQPETVPEEESDMLKPAGSSSPSSRRNSTGSKVPPAYPLRTPARTKRRSVSSTLSDQSSPTGDKASTPFLPPRAQDINFASMLNTPTPIIFSTSLERELLSTLSALGFDTPQIVHSVLTDACDAAGAAWWILKKRVEKRMLEDGEQKSFMNSLFEAHMKEGKSPEDESIEGYTKKMEERRRKDIGVQANLLLLSGSQRATPQLAFVPPTPTQARPSTPPRPTTPSKTPLLSPSPSTITAESSTRSHPATPATAVRDRESKNRKPRSGSVSIMQRATTALEAAGLVRKKSNEAVKDDKERERSKDLERRALSGEESRSSHGSSSSKLTKSPPLKPHKGPTTPPHDKQQHISISSPWVLTESKSSLPEQRVDPPTPANTPGELIHSLSAPNVTEVNQSSKGRSNMRSRPNLLNAFRLWFHEDRKGKRKETAPSGQGINPYSRPATTQAYNTGTGKRRGSNSSGKISTRMGHRAQRPSFSSRRSSSVNSRRSSVASNQMVMLDSPQQIPTRRSLGSHTPNSDKGGGELSSRPSSIHSFSMQPQQRHRKSPSASSVGSNNFRTASPMQKYHRRGGSGSSTRVVRQVQTTPRAMHIRTSSATSSIHSAPSSRPASFYEASEGEGPKQLVSSPVKTRSRRTSEDTSTSSRRSGTNNSSATTFIAQKRQAPFLSPISHSYSNSLARSSWKKSWGLEPPGWRTRTAYIPVQVLAVSPANDSSIRDVFSGRQPLNLGDESDWVDEDDEIPSFAGGLGQLSTTLPTTGSFTNTQQAEPTFTLSPAPQPRTQRSSKRANRNSAPPAINSNMSSRQKPSSGRHSPLPSDNNTTETRTSRRQLPAARPGPAFKHAIQEEDEGEEE
jgi:hypothetical protein